MTTTPKVTATATLVRGNCYVLKDKVFSRGEPVLVSAEERSHLEAHAVDLITVPAYDREGVEEKALPKFTFSPATT